MNTITQGKNNHFFLSIKDECVAFKSYIHKRFKVLTSLVKSPLVTFQHFHSGTLPFLKVAGIIFLITPLKFFILSVVSLDYLNNTFSFTIYAKNFLFTNNPLTYLEMHSKHVASKEKIINYLNKSKKEGTEESEGVKKIKSKYIKAKTELEEEKLKLMSEDVSSSLPVLLLLKAKSDHNGAFIKPGINVKGHSYLKFKLKYDTVLIDNISQIEDIQTGLKKITKPIHQVWILAHGKQNAVLLDEKNQIDKSNIASLSEIFNEKLSKDANVLLYSCNTGSSTLFSSDNIAKKFSEILPGRTIWAPKLPPGKMVVDIDHQELNVRYWVSMSRFELLVDKIWSIFKLHHLKKIGIAWDITAKYKDGKEV